MPDSGGRAGALMSPAETTASTPLRIGMMIGSTSQAAGGVSEALRSLTHALLRQPDTAIDVFSMARSASDTDVDGRWVGARLHQHAVRGPTGFGYAPTLGRSLASRPLDLLHLHGLWMYCSLATRRWAAQSGRPCVVSPHGMLDPWALANSGWKKRIARRFYEDDNLRRATCLHALCEPERQAIRDCGVTAPVCVIPNGVDPVAELLPPPPPDWRRALPSATTALLYLGRLHPKKRVLELIQAWHCAAAADRRSAASWRLIIAGTGPGDYIQRLRERIVELGLSETVHLIGPQYGDAKAATFAAADAFVLPSLSEGLPMAALEAWSYNLPALLTPQCNLPAGFAAGAALQIAPEAGGIAAGLRALFAMGPDERRMMGRKGGDLVAARFTWSRVAAEFHAVYYWLLGKGSRPSSICTG